MARIRTIKPEFFTSDDICGLSPLARLLYIGLWCEADREGRLVWAPLAFKRRYLPDDDCDIDALCEELKGRTLVTLYGDGLAFIPTFTLHQHVNPREQPSKLPPPHPEYHASSRVTDASLPVSDAQGGKERKGKEGEGKEGEGKRARDASTKVPPEVVAERLAADWQPSDDDIAWAATARPDLDRAAIDAETERFRLHAEANARVAHRWDASWRLWISKSRAPERVETRRPGEPLPTLEAESDQQWRARLKNYKPGRFWLENDWGPRPEKPGTRVPPHILAVWRALPPHHEPG